MENERVKDVFEPERRLPLKERRRWARAKTTFELGIWGHPLRILKGVELTTKGEYRNTWPQMVRDNRNLRIALRKKGILAEDCFCAEYSPKNRLLHLHGFYRLQGERSAAELHEILSEFWERIHGAPVVWVQDIYSADGLMKYNLKHALKNYNTMEFGNMRLLKSKGWLPQGWKQTYKVLVKWALQHGASWALDDDISVFPGDYIAYAWEQLRDYLWRWCNGEDIMLSFRTGDVLVSGNKIYEMEYERS